LRRASSSLQPWVFLPDQFRGGDEGSGRWASAARIGRLARGAAYAAVAVLAVAVLVRLYSAVDPPASPASLAAPAGSLTAAAVPRAGARARPGRRALDDLQQRAEGKRDAARFRPHGPGPGALYRCRRRRAAVRTHGLHPTVTRAVALLSFLVSVLPCRATTQG